jgi:hypothetical protein
MYMCFKPTVAGISVHDSKQQIAVITQTGVTFERPLSSRELAGISAFLRMK